MKHKCKLCPKLAVWYYVPNGNTYYCDDCVPRGCGCFIDDYGSEYLDEHGRSLPCIEYDYSERGFYVDFKREI